VKGQTVDSEMAEQKNILQLVRLF